VLLPLETLPETVSKLALSVTLKVPFEVKAPRLAIVFPEFVNATLLFVLPVKILVAMVVPAFCVIAPVILLAEPNVKVAPIAVSEILPSVTVDAFVIEMALAVAFVELIVLVPKLIGPPPPLRVMVFPPGEVVIPFA